MSTIKSQSVTVFLNFHIHDVLKYFATFQPNQQVAKQTYLNALAVYAVDQYLKPFSVVETYLEKGECWQAVPHIEDIADLILPNIGIVECRVVLPEATELDIPVEAMGDRIAYVAVQITKSRTRVELLGYLIPAELQKFPDGKIPFNHLKPIETLVDYLALFQLIIDDRIVEQAEEILHPASVSLPDSGDEIVERVQETLDTHSYSEIVSKLEEMLRTKKAIYHGLMTKNVLTGGSTAKSVMGSVLGDRNNSNNTTEKKLTVEQEIMLEELVQSFLVKLKKLWGNSPSTQS
jgi:hypothetical protein